MKVPIIGGPLDGGFADLDRDDATDDGHMVILAGHVYAIEIKKLTLTQGPKLVYRPRA